MTEILKTKTTHLGNGYYGCRVYKIDGDVLIVETKAKKNEIGRAYNVMLRQLDKLGYNSRMAQRSRERFNEKLNEARENGDNYDYIRDNFKLIWK